ncbi:MAG: N-acetylneuraminate synthase [Candidatus Omnitrophica bacterium]|nr:N-acetylneuraminate synthase [Candidatus Omnitrophota bacterium]
MSIFIIAEAGVNHNGDLGIAMRMVNAAYDAGADAVKFQTFRAERIVSRFASKAEYQKRSTNGRESHLDMLKRLELDIDAHRELMNYCTKKGILFLSSPFDIESVERLEELGLKIYKIPSGEITNFPFLKRIGSLNKKVILSTGMSELREVAKALDILKGAGLHKDDITVLHCNTEYPTPFEDANLSAMITIRDKLNVEVGYSDHTPGIALPIAAAALGATVIEKHFTLDRGMAGPDHRASLEPNELKEMVSAIRAVEKGLGSGIKRPSASELRNIPVVRKSIVAERDIKEGELFSDRNIGAKRPGTGISPLRWPDVIGRAAKKDFKKDEQIEL